MSNTDRSAPREPLAGEPRYRDFEPCEKGRACLAHITHPCDNCGRIGGRYPTPASAPPEPGDTDVSS